MKEVIESQLNNRTEENVNDYKPEPNEISKKSEDCKTNKNQPKEKKIFSKKFQCDKCDKKYTWYSGLANHKRFVHNKQKELKEM